MRYHAASDRFTISADDLRRASHGILYALSRVRKSAGLPLDRYTISGPMKDAEFAAQGMLDAARALGIDLGAEFAEQLDLRAHAG